MENLKENLKKVPWSWVFVITWLILSQYFAMKLVVVPMIMSLLGALFMPPLIVVMLLLMFVPAFFGLASWVALAFRKRIIACILSGIALLIGAGASIFLNKIMGGE